MRLYVRIRGKVHGPFDEPKLLAMVDRGQLSRIHQVSQDGVTWDKASAFPELFTSRVVQPTANTTNASDNRASEPPSEAEVPPGQWYYERSGNAEGPISLGDLKQLVRAGDVTPSTKVWMQDFDDWVEADRVSGLFPESASHQVAQSTPHVFEDANRIAKDPSNRIDERTLMVIGDASGWVVFLSIVGFLIALTLAASGVLTLIYAGEFSQGFRAAAIAQGLFSFAFAAIAATGAFFLGKYASTCKQLIRSKAKSTMTLAMKELKRFWVFAGVVTIVVLVYLTSAAIFVFSTVVSV